MTRDLLLACIGEAIRKRSKAYDAKDRAEVKRMTRRLDALKRRLQQINGKQG